MTLLKLKSLYQEIFIKPVVGYRVLAKRAEKA